MDIKRENIDRYICPPFGACDERYSIHDVDGQRTKGGKGPGGMKEMFHTLVNSVRKHLADKDMDALSLRIDRTFDELEMTTRKLERSGY
ncbi:MAG: hypothetical protein ACP5LW_05825 [Nitrososphaeria archaeon]